MILTKYRRDQRRSKCGSWTLYGDPGFPFIYCSHLFNLKWIWAVSGSPTPRNPLSPEALPSADVFHYDLAHVGNPKMPLVNWTNFGQSARKTHSIRVGRNATFIRADFLSPAISCWGFSGSVVSCRAPLLSVQRENHLWESFMEQKLCPIPSLGLWGEESNAVSSSTSQLYLHIFINYS